MILNHKRVSFKHSSTLKCSVLWKEPLSDQRGEQEARQQALPPLQPCAQWAAFVHTQRKAARVKTVDTLLCSNYMHTIGFNSRTLSKCQLTPAPARWWPIRPHVWVSGWFWVIRLIYHSYVDVIKKASCLQLFSVLAYPRCFRLRTTGLACSN